jgi:hypothetical protein
MPEEGAVVLTMVERVAEALREAYREPETRPYIEMARAAIAAMREPTEEMVLAGNEKASYDYGAARESWSAMIDEALK